MTSRIVTSSRIAAAAIALVGFAGNASAQVVGFGGAGMTGWTPNTNTAGLPSVSGTGTAADVLTLTTNNNGIATSYWFNTPQNITNFTESFTYTSNGGADGIAVVWQNSGLTALGGGGGSLGFGGITSAAALGMNIYGGNSGSGAQFNNATGNGTGVATTPTPSGVDITSGHPINVSLSYKQSDGALTETMTDTNTSATFTRVWRGVSIQGQLGGTTGTIGLTGATGGVNSTQTITNFHFQSGNAAATPVPTITPIATTGYNQNMISSAANGAANVTATMDGGTGRGGDTFYEVGTNPGSNVSGVPVAGSVFGSGNDSKHTFAFQPNGAGQNDAVMLDASSTSGTVSLVSPNKYSVLSFLVAAGNGGRPLASSTGVPYVINYQGGGTQSGFMDFQDWFNGGPIAWDANGRANVTLSDFNNVNNGNPRLYQEDVTLTDVTHNVLSINFTWPGIATDGDREAIFALSGTAVPEPSSMALLSLGAAGLLAGWGGARRAI
jgi:hypothetical protein